MARGFIVTVTVFVPTHPLVVPVTVYVCVAFGDAVTLEPVVGVILLFGAHVYDDAPLAVRPTLLPAHMVGAEGKMLTAGVLTNVTTAVAVSWQPPEEIPTTEYVVVLVGLAVIDALVALVLHT